MLSVVSSVHFHLAWWLLTNFWSFATLDCIIIGWHFCKNHVIKAEQLPAFPLFTTKVPLDFAILAKIANFFWPSGVKTIRIVSFFMLCYNFGERYFVTEKWDYWIFFLIFIHCGLSSKFLKVQFLIEMCIYKCICQRAKGHNKIECTCFGILFSEAQIEREKLSLKIDHGRI